MNIKTADQLAEGDRILVDSPPYPTREEVVMSAVSAAGWTTVELVGGSRWQVRTDRTVTLLPSEV